MVAPEVPGLLTLLLVAAVVAAATLLRDRLGFRRAVGVALAAVFLTTSAVGLVLLDLGLLHAHALWIGLSCAFALLLSGTVMLRRRLPRFEAPRDGSRAWIGLMAVVVVFGTVIRLSPSPYLHGGQDQGIYVNVGHHIARTGRLRPVDPVLAGRVRGISAADVRAGHRIAAIDPESVLKGVREGRWNAGIHVEDAERGVLIPAFFHLLPVWFAMAEHDWGFARSTWPLVLFWLLSALAAFGLAVRVDTICSHGRAGGRSILVGALAVAALALHPLDLWISTFTVSENLARACLLGAAWLALEGASAEREGRAEATLLSVLGGLCFAAGAFTRGTLVAYALALAVALLWSPAAPSRPRTGLLVGLAAGTSLAVVQAVMHSWPYFFSAASNHFHVPRLRPHQDVAVMWTAAVGVLIWIADRVLEPLRARPRFAGRARASLRWMTWLLLAGAVVAAIHEAIDPSNEWGRDQQVLPVLLRYSGPAPLLLGIAGLALAVRRADDRTRPWLFLGAAIMLLTALKQGIRYEFYYARYLVADAVPVLLVSSACLVGHGASYIRERWGGRAAALASALVVVGWLAPPLPALSREVYWKRDLADGPRQLAEMFGHVPDDAVLFFDARAPGRWRGILATPALLSFDRRVLNYPDNKIVEGAIKAGTPVYMLSGGWEADDRQAWPDAAHGPWRTVVVARGQYTALRAEVAEGRMPAELTDWGGRYELQRIDRSIWRSSGAFSVYPESDYVRAADDRIETEARRTPWPAGSRVELWLAPGDTCEVAAALVRDGVVLELAPLAGDQADRLLWALPEPRPEVEWHLELRGTCAGARRLAWRWLSVRPAR